MEEVLSGNADAFAELIRNHHAQVIGLCRSMLQDPSAAEDAAQEIFLKAYRRLSAFRADSAFSTWLYRIGANHCLDLLRARAREKTDSLEALPPSAGVYVAKLVESGPGNVLDENSDLLERVMAELNPDYRLILTLREVQGLNYQELAETLGCSLDAVKARLKRSRKALGELVRHLLEVQNV